MAVLLDQPRWDACRWATGESDASAGARPGAESDGCPERRLLAVGAEKLVALARDVQERGEPALPLERLAQPVSLGRCTPDVVQSAAQSREAAASAAALQWDARVSARRRPLVAPKVQALQKLMKLVPRAVSSTEASDARPESPEAQPPREAEAVRRVALEL